MKRSGRTGESISLLNLRKLQHRGQQHIKGATKRSREAQPGLKTSVNATPATIVHKCNRLSHWEFNVGDALILFCPSLGEDDLEGRKFAHHHTGGEKLTTVFLYHSPTPSKEKQAPLRVWVSGMTLGIDLKSTLYGCRQRGRMEGGWKDA